MTVKTLSNIAQEPPSLSLITPTASYYKVKFQYDILTQFIHNMMKADLI